LLVQRWYSYKFCF